jgi:hypothetical protein
MDAVTRCLVSVNRCGRTREDSSVGKGPNTAPHVHAGPEGHSDQAANGRSQSLEQSGQGPIAHITRVRAYLLTTQRQVPKPKLKQVHRRLVWANACAHAHAPMVASGSDELQTHRCNCRVCSSSSNSGSLEALGVHCDNGTHHTHTDTHTHTHTHTRAHTQTPCTHHTHTTDTECTHTHTRQTHNAHTHTQKGRKAQVRKPKEMTAIGVLKVSAHNKRRLCHQAPTVHEHSYSVQSGPDSHQCLRGHHLVLLSAPIESPESIESMRVNRVKVKNDVKSASEDLPAT